MLFSILCGPYGIVFLNTRSRPTCLVLCVAAMFYERMDCTRRRAFFFIVLCRGSGLGPNLFSIVLDIGPCVGFRVHLLESCRSSLWTDNGFLVLCPLWDHVRGSRDIFACVRYWEVDLIGGDLDFLCGVFLYPAVSLLSHYFLSIHLF